MLITPRVSEKSYKSAADNVYVFDVPLSANKYQVAAAIEAENDGVKVRDVRLVVVKGKPKSVNRGKRARPTTTTRKDFKKAYVTLADGKIEIAAFSEIDNQMKAEAAKDVTASDAKQSSKDRLDRRAEESARDDKGGAETKKAGLFARKRTGRRGDK
ncbi:MAG: 50S ribosomal protein L23 [Candidatus Nomurabacteria bacterium]|jgi:large subunit ribosomal protein L23|nr:50S ribosomal protein L23 [Candidatus Nomurabacteria bacterium]